MDGEGLRLDDHHVYFTLYTISEVTIWPSPTYPILFVRGHHGFHRRGMLHCRVGILYGNATSLPYAPEAFG